MFVNNSNVCFNSYFVLKKLLLFLRDLLSRMNLLTDGNSLFVREVTISSLYLHVYMSTCTCLHAVASPIQALTWLNQSSHDMTGDPVRMVDYNFLVTSRFIFKLRGPGSIPGLGGNFSHFSHWMNLKKCCNIMLFPRRRIFRHS